MKRLSLIIVTLFITIAGASAQNFRTGYFLDGYMYKYQLNPAFQGERGFISLPVLGGVSLGVESNLSLGTFYYPSSNGTMITFLHPEISDESFMKQIKKSNPMNLNLDMNMMALGFRVKNTYHTIDMSIKSAHSVALPGDLFKLLKVGGADGNRLYDLSSLNLTSNTYSQLAYGFSIKIKDFISVGMRAKLLIGVLNIQSDISSLQLSLEPDKWSLKSDGGSVIVPTLVSDALSGNVDEDQSLDGLMDYVVKPSFGAAFDLGVSVDFLEHFTASASILDLGFISWKNMSRMNLSTGYWEYTGLDNIFGEGSDVNSQLGDELEELGSVFKLETAEQLDKHVQRLGCTTLLGLEFRMPFYERMSVGVLGTHRFEGASSWTEGRFSLNLAPARWFSLTANYAVSTFGHSYGAAINLHPKIFNLFVGLDSFKPLLNMTPSFIPIDEMNTNVKFGITFPFGKYNGRFPKRVSDNNE